MTDEEKVNKARRALGALEILRSELDDLAEAGVIDVGSTEEEEVLDQLESFLDLLYAVSVARLAQMNSRERK